MHLPAQNSQHSEKYHKEKPSEPEIADRQCSKLFCDCLKLQSAVTIAKNKVIVCKHDED